jgi:predicted nucleic acid-binding protein
VIQTFYEQVALFDTSAVIALHDPQEPRHAAVRSLYANAHDLIWAALDVTSHECFTRVRYSRGLQPAFEQYGFLRDGGIKLIRFEAGDENTALDVLRRYADHTISFHDALCFAVMKRHGIFRVVSVDSDFQIFGLEVLPQ